jgi:hypothetical protein
MMKKAWLLLVFVFTGVWGFYHMKSTWSGTSYINLVQLKRSVGTRDPAAIRKVYDFSTLNGSSLMRATKQRLLSGTKVVQGNGQVGIELGHFVVNDLSGKRQFACDVFNTVELKFKSQGYAVNGERAELVVQAPCVVAPDVNQISAIPVPFELIKQEEPGEVELSYADYPDQKFTVMNVLDSWPETWEVVEIVLKDSEDPAQYITVEKMDIREWYQGPMGVKWASASDEF